MFAESSSSLRANSSAGPFTQALSQRPNRTMIRLTPLIDVVFILLVFFMLAPRYTEPRALTFQAGPSAEDQSGTEDHSDANAQTITTEFQRSNILIVQIQGEQLLFQGQTITLEALTAQLNQGRTDRESEASIQIQPLEPTKVQQLINLLDQLSAAGIQPLQLMPAPVQESDINGANTLQESIDALP